MSSKAKQRQRSKQRANKKSRNARFHVKLDKGSFGPLSIGGLDIGTRSTPIDPRLGGRSMGVAQTTRDMIEPGKALALTVYEKGGHLVSSYEATDLVTTLGGSGSVGTSYVPGDVVYTTLLGPQANLSQRVAKLAGMFQNYRLKRFRVLYAPSCPTDTPGQLVFYVDRDPTSEISDEASNIYKATAQEGSRTSQVWQPNEMDLSGLFKDPLWVRDDGDAPKLTYAGVLNVIAMTSTPKDVPLGTLSIDLAIEFFTPCLSDDASPVRALYGGGAFSSATALFGPTVTWDPSLLHATQLNNEVIVTEAVVDWLYETTVLTTWTDATSSDYVDNTARVAITGTSAAAEYGYTFRDSGGTCGSLFFSHGTVLSSTITYSQDTNIPVSGAISNGTTRISLTVRSPYTVGSRQGLSVKNRAAWFKTYKERRQPTGTDRRIAELERQLSTLMQREGLELTSGRPRRGGMGDGPFPTPRTHSWEESEVSESPCTISSGDPNPPEADVDSDPSDNEMEMISSVRKRGRLPQRKTGNLAISGEVTRRG